MAFPGLTMNSRAYRLNVQLLYLQLLYLRTYYTYYVPIAVSMYRQYLLYANVLLIDLLLCSTYYVQTYVRTAQLMYVRKRYVLPLHSVFCMHVLHLHVLAGDARTYIEEKKVRAAISAYLLLYVSTYCTCLMYVRT